MEAIIEVETSFHVICAVLYYRWNIDTSLLENFLELESKNRRERFFVWN